MNPMLLVPCSATALAALLSGQNPMPGDAAAAAVQADRIPVHTRAAEPGEAPYGIWAAGSLYKASFHDGVTFVPALGAGEPHNLPVTWRTKSVRIGERELLLGAGEPSPRFDGFRCEFDHGEVLEGYDVLAEGLEQTFLVRRALGATGDLVVRGALSGALAAEAVEAHHGELMLRDVKGRALVRYGAAVAIDAAGARLPMTTRAVDGTVELRLAAADLAHVTFPLLVDPLLSVVQLQTGAGPFGESDVGVEGESVSYGALVAYTRYFSASDTDVVARMGTPAFSSMTTVFSDISTTTVADRARVAFVAGADRWVVVYDSLQLSTGVMRIRAHVHDKSNLTFSSSSIGRLNAVGDHDWRPSVGGTVANSSGTHALIAFQRETTPTATFAPQPDSSVMALLFDASAPSGQFGVPFPIYQGTNVDVERPCVSRTAEGGPSFSWIVVCQTYSNSIAGDDWDLVGKRVQNDGTVAIGAWISSLGTVHKVGASVDGRDGRYAVVFASAPTSAGKIDDARGDHVHCERFDWAHGAASPSPVGNQPAVEIASTLLRVYEAGGIGYDGQTRSHWATGFRNTLVSGPAYALRIGCRGRPIGPVATLHSAAGDTAGRIGVACRDYDGRALFVHSVTGAGAGTVNGRVLETALPTLAAQYGTGCGVGVLSWTGPASYGQRNQWIGSEFVGPRAIGATGSSVHVLMVAIDAVNLPVVHPLVAPGCTQLVPSSGPNHLGVLPLGFGSTVDWRLSLPEQLPPMTLHFQDWIYDAYHDNFHSTAGLSVPIGR